MARGRRGHGEGSIRERMDGRWEIRIDLGRGLNGRRQQKSVFAATEADAIHELKRLHGRTVGGHVLVTSTPTVGRFLDEWFADHEDAWRPSTRRSYRGAIDGYLVPAFGSLRLEHLTPRHVQRWLTEHKTQHGARRRITLAHAMLRSALSEARRLQTRSGQRGGTRAACRNRRHGRSAARRRPGARLSRRRRRASPRRALLGRARLRPPTRRSDRPAMGRRRSRDRARSQIRQQLQRVGKRLVLKPLKTAKSRRTLVLPRCVPRGAPRRIARSNSRNG